MRSRFAFTVTVFLVGMPGCLYHGYYPPNGYYGSGTGLPPGQPMNAYPATPMYQPGTPVYQPGTPVIQPGNSPTPLNGNQPTFNPTDPNNPQTYGSGGIGAPPFNATPGNNNSGGGVPNPGDDNNSDFNRGTNRTPLTPTTSATSPNDVSTPFSQESRLPRNFSDEATAETYLPFERPVVQSKDGRGGDIQQVNSQSPAGKPAKTYAHHPQFNWVQGVIEFDEPSNTWVIMYDDNPRTSDRFGGELTIAGDLSSERLRSGDIVRITGAINENQEDARGRPVFQVSRLQKL